MRIWSRIARVLGPARDGTRLTYAAFAAYDAARAEEGAADSTRQGELALVRAAMHEAKRAAVLPIVPDFPTIKVNNAREGFLRDGDFGALMTVLPDYLRAPIHWAFITGWRKSELLAMKWDWVDRDAGEIRLPWRCDKGKGIRPVPYSAHPELERLIEGQWTKAEAIRHRTNRPVDTVFFFERPGPRSQPGSPIKCPKNAWDTARRRAGLPTLTIHDMRRTAVRNMERASVSRVVAMSITGHKTESIYKRYAIIDEQSQREGLKKYANNAKSWAEV